MEDGLRIRFASPEDAPTIVKQRRAMFEEIRDYSPDKLDAMDAAYLDWVRDLLVSGEYVSWLVINEAEEVVAGAGLWVQQLMPNPFESTGYRGHIVNVFTEPDYRHRGLARELMLTLLDWCKAHDVTSATLNASQFGKPLYESLGFEQDNHMIIHLY
jgi:GNAT superfamily N-acetyltransferase